MLTFYAQSLLYESVKSIVASALPCPALVSCCPFLTGPVLRLQGVDNALQGNSPNASPATSGNSPSTTPPPSITGQVRFPFCATSALSLAQVNHTTY